MAQELTVSFIGVDKFTIAHNNQTTAELPFVDPLTKEDWEDMQWYLEVYATQYAADVDDDRAARVAAKLQVWGQGLFRAVFEDRSAARLFNAFQDAEGEGRQISITASAPEILRLPWELLCDSKGTFLLHENPRIGLRRQLAGAGGGRSPIAVEPKETLRLLMVVSRPDGAGFIDPRAEGQAVLKAIERSAPGRIVVEFLRPATLEKLIERLENHDLPAVDIMHFDGHGVFSIDDKNPQGMGYLLFEDHGSKIDKISAKILGDVLQDQQVSLMVLSACESAKLTTETDAMGCIAARLTNCGIPAVLAMTYSVLTVTTEQLFGKFYGELAEGKLIGEALAIARQDLEQTQGRGLRWRLREQITLNLSDWFLPAFYQVGDDARLLTKGEMAKPPEIKAELPWSRFSEMAEEGFFGRSSELWLIEKLFVKGRRRFTISGFGGQGKTYLALEAGRWLCQTGMFDVVCFVDYAFFQGVEPVDWAVAELSMVLGQSFVDADAVKLGLQKQRTMVILDNLESLQPEALQGLLTVASGWSVVGETRLLLTTRDQQLNHPDYSIGRNEYLLLKGLGDEENPEDAINYFQKLMKLPPEPMCDLPGRDDLIKLFKLVDFHPLSIRSVALQLKERQIGDLVKSLQELLQDGQGSLVASLNLSLQRLPDEMLQILPKLSVFQGGAWEPMILMITEFEPAQWQQLKLALVKTGLLQIEADIDFLRFHPTFSLVLWEKLSDVEQEDIQVRYQQHYYGLTNDLYLADSQDPCIVRLIVRRDLPNLLWALKGSLVNRSDNAVNFLNKVDRFLYIFGLQRERLFLSDWLDQFNFNESSTNWYLGRSNRGEQLFQAGQYAAAAEIFTEILANLDSEQIFDRISTLGHLGRCLRDQGKLSAALQYLQEGLALSSQLEQNEKVKKHQGVIQSNLGDIFRHTGDFSRAYQAYEISLIIDEETEDQRGAAVTKCKMGALSILQFDLANAAQKYQEALNTFQQLQEPTQEAGAWNSLGIIHEKNQQWEEANWAYREAARIKEQQNNIHGVAITYAQLASLNTRMNQIYDAEAWYKKALQNFRLVGDQKNESMILFSLANLINDQPDRLVEVQSMANAALRIQRDIDSAAVEIWKTYDLLAKIAFSQSETKQAQEYRQLSRALKANHSGTKYELQDYEALILSVASAFKDKAAREELEKFLPKLEAKGKRQLVVAIQRILAGESSIEALWDDLDADDYMIIQAIIDRFS
jgi:tetratricopeptide (TPR) repeat protein